jgi:hypothetical protein
MIKKMSNEFEKYNAFEKHLTEKYPKIFSQPYGGIACGEGWWPIVESLCGQIQHHINWRNKFNPVVPQVTVAQIKEKFGGLRFYYEGGDDTIAGMVSMAESWASKTCEICGVPATRQTTGWIKNVCDEHFNKIEARKKESII